MPKFRIIYTLHIHHNDGCVEVEADDFADAEHKAHSIPLAELMKNASGTGCDLEIFDTEQRTFPKETVPFPEECEFADSKEGEDG